ncbi:MAG: hemolysin family protein [Ruminococcus sp.]|nr:hemolysin family protein [Ruminococcus sp.]MDE7225301.1 hemolysin family protein [Ruminococcus sp.]
MFWQIILQIILISVNAVFSYAESAIISANPAQIEKLADDGDKRAVLIKKLNSEPSRLFSSVRTVTMLSGFMGSAFASDFFSVRILNALCNAGFEEYKYLLKPVSVIVPALILVCITIIFGELVPKRAGMKNPEKNALRFSGLIRGTKIIFSPLVWILDFISGIILKIFGVNPDNITEDITEEEIIMMSDAGAEKGTIDETEHRIIKNVFAFDDMTAEQVCTHRTDVSVLWVSDSVETWEDTIHRTRHSIYPVCGDSVDDVVGILNAKDYFRLDDKSHGNIMKNAVREPYFVHENMKADRLFAQMKKNGGNHFAVVVDEYGGMSGIITVTDLVEQLVGEFDDDELEQPEAEFRKTGENQWIIPGITSLSDVCDELDVKLPCEKYDTFGGYIIAELGEIPKDGTRLSVECDGLHIDILKIYHHRIELTKTSVIKKTENGI